MSAYTYADVQTASTAVHALLTDGQPHDRLDEFVAILDAVAPAIAARALHELADAMSAPDWNHKDDWGVSVIYPNALRTRADLLKRT